MREAWAIPVNPVPHRSEWDTLVPTEVKDVLIKPPRVVALRFGYEVGSLMYYGHNCYDYDPHHTVYPLLNAENLQEFMERMSPYEPLFDIFVIKNPSNEFLSFINPRNIPLRKLSCDQSGRRATECIKVGTHCGTPLLLRDVAFDPEKEERRQREEREMLQQ